MVRRILVVPYDVTWPSQSAHERRLLEAILGPELLRVHPIGSTAVPGMWAKPIIDLLAEARDIEAIDGYGRAMVEAGYLPRGENGLPGRRFFVRGSEEQRWAHVHIY